ncbi:contact-dependent growth inhibition system immunity protein [Nocardia transvalensis]|uniref:contact-dependent growth inhibition system immunity protein n=1 Tax=Nocardia transvalensis TaxID=37333 RepID=UPI001894D4C3|nr:contact-dependent growth inhibition system immunity protein [Nocardia transvalensis]MBF6329701.1 hypothetical protein [Nocardia transvalensis]
MSHMVGNAGNRSVEDIEGDAWDAAQSDATYVIRRIHELRRVPVREFGIEDMRIMLSQKVGTAAVLPRALDVLEGNPLSSGDFYPGDLLVAVLGLGPDHWSGDAALLDRARRIAEQAEAVTAELGGSHIREIRRLASEFLSD